MKSVNGWPSCLNSFGIRSSPLSASANRNVIVIPTGKPTASARSERRARSRRRCTSATQSPAIGPNSGPTIIAPMIRITWSVRMPTAAISIARVMNARKLAESSMFSDVRASTSSQITASDGMPTAAFWAALPTADICESITSIAIDPSRSTSSSRRSEMMTLASARVTSHSMTSPSGFWAAPGRKIRLQTVGDCSSRSRTWSAW